ncbi:MAG: hypothetical protein ACK5Q5_04920 [Planctomycetaceae bacterium]
MERIATQKASDIDRPARQWLQQLLGHALADDDSVTVVVATPHPAPRGESKQQAFEQMNRLLDRTADQLRDVSDEEFDAVVDEAMRSVRPSSRD